MFVLFYDSKNCFLLNVRHREVWFVTKLKSHPDLCKRSHMAILQEHVCLYILYAYKSVSALLFKKMSQRGKLSNGSKFPWSQNDHLGQNVHREEMSIECPILNILTRWTLWRGIFHEHWSYSVASKYEIEKRADLVTHLAGGAHLF